SSGRIEKVHKVAEEKIEIVHEKAEQKIELVHRESENKIDMLHENYANDIKETFGIVSHRTVEQFIAEKVPSNLTQDSLIQLVLRALNKYVKDSIIDFAHSYGQETKVIRNDTLLFDPNDSTSHGCWTVGEIKF